MRKRQAPVLLRSSRGRVQGNEGIIASLTRDEDGDEAHGFFVLDDPPPPRA